jgi:excinuclease ABC subunit A
MDKNVIRIRGARVNNLKGVDLDIPLSKLTCFFGVSGSGKTSIAFHTLYTESKRRFLNSFPTYLKFFSDRPSPVDVDEIFPVLPVFGLPQVNPVVGTRSNVADVMHLTELLQSTYFNFSEQLCPDHKVVFEESLFSDRVESVIGSMNSDDVFHLFITGSAFVDFFQDSPFPSRSMKTDKSKKIDDFSEKHEFWEILRFKKKGLKELNTKIKVYLNRDIKIYIYSEKMKELTSLDYKVGALKCSSDKCAVEALNVRTAMNFSPYNALGACQKCSGFGETLEYDLSKLVDKDKSIKDGGITLLNYKRFGDQQDQLVNELKKKKISITKKISELDDKFWKVLYDGSNEYAGFNSYFKYFERSRYKMNVRIFVRHLQKGLRCSECDGSRFSHVAKQFYLDKNLVYSLSDLCFVDINTAQKYFKASLSSLINPSTESRKSLKKIISILDSAVGVGLGHLDLLRKAKTLSAGEYQRLLLLKYLSYEGTGSLFVFDEPSLGLSDTEKKELLKGFNKLILQKNTVVVVDHSLFFRKKSDYLIEMGPGAGALGGNVLFADKASEYKYPKSKLKLEIQKPTSKTKWINVKKPEIYSKEFCDFELPINEISWVTGASGSGKSACLVNTLATKLHYDVKGQHLNMLRGSAKSIKYNFSFKDVIIVDANLNRYTSRSTVGSMTELFTVIRKHFVKTPMAKAMNLVDGNFSYYSELGQCPKCEGKGVEIVEMQFLEDIILTCEDCKGKRLKSIFADFSDGAMTVHEAYSRPLSEVLPKIKLTPKFKRIFEYIKILNLDYLSVNRSINSLSGGEKQRIYLLNKLLKDISDSILFFENISFGLSENELIKICEFFQGLTTKSNTIVIIDQDQIFKNIANHNIKFS